MNREYVLLAKVFNDDRHRISGWYLSTKLDGQRCLWDGGVSTGYPKRQIPWANNNRDDRYIEAPTATGLWSRYGNVIHAPQWFINQLPKGVMLDGELYMGRNLFQETRKIVSTIEPGRGWSEIKYHVFDKPSPNTFFQNGQIKNPNNEIFIAEDDCWRYYHEKPIEPVTVPEDMSEADKPEYIAAEEKRIHEAIKRRNLVHPFVTNHRLLSQLPTGDNWLIEPQIKLSINESEAKDVLYSRLAEELAAGGEGVMLRNPDSIWTPHRSDNLLKVKGMEDAEAIVMGFVNGYGKLRGAIGAVVIQYTPKGGGAKEFQLSGFTDDERQYDCEAARIYAYQNPGELMIGPHNGLHFKRGDVISFKYRGLTNDGVPREARYWRKPNG